MSAEKTPIEASDIRAGDLIRWESLDGDEAHESRITDPRHTGFTQGQHYLLDRPTPAVELPTEPTLGFVTAAGGRTSAAIAGLSSKFSPIGGSGRIYVRAGDPFGFDQIERITAFTPATAVPTEALEDLRGFTETAWSVFNLTNHLTETLKTLDSFLRAIDEANA